LAISQKQYPFIVLVSLSKFVYTISIFYMQTKDPFTPQEKRILSFIEKGLASKQIAGTLNIKKETVDRHR
jgi:DNA-binding NarL/FixJ family response regulator